MVISALSQRFNRKEALRDNRASVRAVLMCAVFSFTTLGVVSNAAADDEAFTIRHAETRLVNKVYQLSADLDYSFTDEVREAIDSGVPMVLVMDIELYRPRDYIWDKEVASLQQRFKLQYHAVAEQYIVTNINSGAQQTYHSLYSAIESIRSIHDIPVIDAQLLDPGVAYTLRLRMSLELSSLPVPLRLTAYFSSKWRLDSDWYNLALSDADKDNDSGGSFAQDFNR
jgi:hypothetical protein